MTPAGLTNPGRRRSWLGRPGQRDATPVFWLFDPAPRNTESYTPWMLGPVEAAASPRLFGQCDGVAKTSTLPAPWPLRTVRLVGYSTHRMPICPSPWTTSGHSNWYQHDDDAFFPACQKHRIASAGNISRLPPCCAGRKAKHSTNLLESSEVADWQPAIVLNCQ